VLLIARQPSLETAIEPFPLSPGLSDESALQQDGVKLFISRASRANPRFRLRPGDAATINELCNRFDNLPLAIELLASWTDVLKPDEMLKRDVSMLESRGTGGDPRHA
jgi:predicted ATPase